MKKGTKEEIKAETSEERIAPAEEAISSEGKVGGMLHDARVKKGYKLEDVSKELYIRKSFLEAIESSNYEEIPEPPYGIGFIRSYAEQQPGAYSDPLYCLQLGHVWRSEGYLSAE